MKPVHLILAAIVLVGCGRPQQQAVPQPEPAAVTSLAEVFDYPERFKGKEVTAELVLWTHYDPRLFSQTAAEKSGSKLRYFHGRPSTWGSWTTGIHGEINLLVPDDVEAPNISYGGFAIVTFTFSGRLTEPSKVTAIRRKD